MSEQDKKNYQAAPYDVLAKQYDQGLSQILGIWGKDNEKFAEYKIQFLHIKLSHQINSIFDFGCGTGRSLRYLKQYFTMPLNAPTGNDNRIAISGCDISRESIKIAQQNEPDADIFLCTNVEELLAHNGKYDLIFLSCVLHHMDPEIRVSWMKALSEQLSEKGRVAIFEHNLKNPYTRYIVNKPENTEDREEFMLSRKDVSLLLAEAGLITEFSGYTLFMPVRRPWVTKLETYLTWLPIGAQHCVIGRKKAS